jgi:c-di-AMP phosphodiesterase-like protein
MKIKPSLLQILFIVSSIIFTFWLFVSGSWGWGLSVLLVILLQIFYLLRNQTFISKSNSILEICPHCKNHNTNRSTTCEWCGNQIA